LWVSLLGKERTLPILLNPLIVKEFISNPHGSRGQCQKGGEGHGPLAGAITTPCGVDPHFSHGKGNGIVNPLGRKGSYVKPVKMEEALAIHQEKLGHFTIHVGQKWRKEKRALSTE
jgi:hypothetical protein